LNEIEEKTPMLGKLIGILLIIVGLGLIAIGISYYVGIPNIPSQFQTLANYLSSVGAINMFMYGILSISLGFGLIKAQEWAAGGTFVLLVIVIVNLATYVYYWITTFGTSQLPFSVLASIATIIISFIILVYLVKSVGWR